jgi:single-stranded DNA-binding protein
MSIEAAFMGRLAADAESKISKNGKAYLRLRLRVGDGDAAQWVGVTVFDETAINNATSLVKGSTVYVEGRLSLDTWVAQDGKPRHGLSVLASHCRLAQIGRNRPRQERPAFEHA